MSKQKYNDSEINWPSIAIFVVLVGIIIIAAQQIPILGQALKDMLGR
jgi:hypothetical protein